MKKKFNILDLLQISCHDLNHNLLAFSTDAVWACHAIFFLHIQIVSQPQRPSTTGGYNHNLYVMSIKHSWLQQESCLKLIRNILTAPNYNKKDVCIYCIPHFFVDIPQLAEELFVNSSVKLKVQDEQSKKTNKFLSLVNFMGFTLD